LDTTRRNSEYLGAVNTEEEPVARSYNGWYAAPDLPIRPLEVAGESFVPGVLDDDDVYTVLRYVAQQMHERVEPIVRDDWHQMDDWGFSFRPSTGDPDALSCHASATAVDYNATRHPYGVHGTWSPGQIREVHEILDEVDNVVAWGEDWNLPDGMHLEIKGNKAAVAAAADKIRNRDEDDMKAEDFQKIREIVAEEINAQFAEQINVKTDTGTRRISYTQLFRELWQKTNKHV
jgi:hypothetical protein